MSGTMDVFLSVFVSSQGEPVKESEENWESRDRALKALGDEASSLSDRLVTGGQLRTVVESILVSTGSLRTTLVITACTTCASLCAALGPAPLDPLVHIMLPRLLKLAGNAKKLVAGAGASAVLALLKHAPLHARTVTTLATGASDKNAQVRAHCVAFLKALMEGAAGDEHARILLDKSGALDTLERCLKKSLSDATPAVREASRGVFDVMRVCWPARAESVLNSLDPSTKKAVMKNPSNFKFAKPSVSLPAKLAMSAISSTPAMLKTSFPRPSSASPTSAPVHGTQLPEHVESEGDEVITMPDTPSQLLANLQSSNEVTVTQAISSMDSNLLRQFSPGQFSELRKSFASLLSHPSPKTFEVIAETNFLALLLSHRLVEEEVLARASISILTGETPGPHPSLTPALQGLLKNYILTHLAPTLALQSLSKSLLLSSTTQTPGGPRFKAAVANPASDAAPFLLDLTYSLVSRPDGAAAAAQAASLRTLLHPLTRLIALRSTEARTRERVEIVLRALAGLNEAAFRRFLETLDFEIASSILEAVGMPAEEESEESKVVVEVDSGDGESRSDIAADFDVRDEGVSDMGSSLRDLGNEEGASAANLADITFESGLVDESLLMEASEKDLESSYAMDSTPLFDSVEPMGIPETPRQLPQQLLRSVAAFQVSGGMVGFAVDATQPACDEATPMKKTAPLETASGDLGRWMDRFTAGDFSHAVLEALFKHSCDVARNADSAPTPPDTMVNLSTHIFRVIHDYDLPKDAKESLFLILNELLLIPKVRETIPDLDVVAMLLSSRSDARFEVAGSADTVLNTFMDHMNVCFCFDGLVRVFEEGIFDLWSLDPAADDYQPHPYASAFFYMGHLIRNRVGHEIEEDRWNVVHLMGICSRGMASPHVEVRRAALLCLVDISKQWTLQQDGFWARIGDMLSPSQLHLLQAYVAQ